MGYSEENTGIKMLELVLNTVVENFKIYLNVFCVVKLVGILINGAKDIEGEAKGMGS